MSKIQNRILHLSVMAIMLTGMLIAFQVRTASAHFSPSSPTFMDFNGDGKAEATLYDPKINFWFTYDFVKNKVEKVSFGGGTPVPGDYDGDGKTDVAVCYHDDEGNKIWSMIASSTQARSLFQWGVIGDVPVPGDYDGDGQTDYAVFRAREGVWYISRSSDKQITTHLFGLENDRPVPADYDGDGKTDLAIFRKDDNAWHILHSGSDMALDVTKWSGTLKAGDVALPADYDGDGKADFAVYGASKGEWRILQSSNLTYRNVKFGMGVYNPDIINDPALIIFDADQPLPGDYDGDGLTDLAVYSVDTHLVHVLASKAGYMTSQLMGSRKALPVSTSLFGQ
jgi:hypothetical protein